MSRWSIELSFFGAEIKITHEGNMTASDLKYQHETKNPQSHYFTRDTMRFFGDTMANFSVHDGGDHWELFRRKKTPKGAPSGVIARFCKSTFRRVR